MVTRRQIPMKSDPILLDRVLQEIQTELMAKLPWLINAYGRAYPRSEEKNNRIVTYPVFYRGSGGYDSLLPDDRYSGMSYFEIYDPQEVESIGGGIPKISASGALIIWYNQDKIFDDHSTLYTEEIKRDVLKVLMRPGILSSGRLEVKKVYEKFESIYKEYNLKDMNTSLLTFPYAGLRIEFELITKELCR